jgi:hypothetical protein
VPILYCNYKKCTYNELSFCKKEVVTMRRDYLHSAILRKKIVACESSLVEIYKNGKKV